MKVVTLVLASILFAVPSLAQIPDYYSWLSTPEGVQKSSLKTDLAKAGYILLDSDAAYPYEDAAHHHVFIAEIVFGIDRGYGYSNGPFRGYIWLDGKGTEGHGAVHWYRIFAAPDQMDQMDYLLAATGFHYIPWPNGATYKWSQPPIVKAAVPTPSAYGSEEQIVTAERELTAVYQNLVKRLSPAQRAVLKKDEINWISSKDQLSAAEKLDSVKKRIRFLQQYRP
jgi:hypothetical protein